MDIEPHIAWRYLFSKKGHNAIHIVSGISAAAVAVVTAAMICVLSVMNGFGALVEQLFSEFDAPLLVVPAQGQTLRTDSLPIASLYAREDLEAVSMQLEQTALIRYKDHQIPARILGVDSLFTRTAHIDSVITDGYFSVWDGAFDRTVLGQGLAAQIGMNAHFTGALHLYAPKRTGQVNMLRPDLSLQHEHAFIAGTFAINQLEYDNQLVLVSLELAQRLFGYDTHTATALRLTPKDKSQISNLKSQISKTLGEGFRVLDRYEQQADFFRILRIEKLLTFLLLVFILLIASFNTIGSLSMLIIDKSEDIRILSHLGADEPMIRRIFRMEGTFIAALGTVAGLVIGIVVCMGQQHFGWLKLGSGTDYIISAYPVLVQPLDILLVAVIVMALGFAAAWYPSRKIQICLIGCLFLLPSCQPSKIIQVSEWPEEWEITYQESYGRCYDSVPYPVVALDLYADGLTLDSTHHMQGSGCNLYLSDIFVPDSLLAPGTYTSIPLDSLHRTPYTVHPYTFLPGRDFEGTPHGIYLLRVENAKLKTIQVIDSGRFTLRDTANSLTDIRLTLYYTNSEKRVKTYECHFQGPLQLWQKQ